MLYFIHGLNGSPREWNVFTEFFTERGFDCKAIDLKKGLDLKKVYFKDYVEKVSGLVSTEDILIGHSMGGLIVQKVAEETTVKAGVCICSAAPNGIPMKTVPWWRQVRYIPFMLFGIPFKPSFGLVKDVFLSGWDEEKQKKIYGRLQKQSAHVSYEVMKQKISVDEKKISCPLYFIGRKEDVTIPPDIVKRIAQKYHSNFDAVSGNHYIFEDWIDIAEHTFSFIQTV